MGAAMLAAACQFSQLPRPPQIFGPGPSEVAQESQEVLDLLAYFQRMTALPPDELRKEYASVNGAYQRDKSENQRMKLALLLSVPGASFRDDARLSALLEGAVGRGAAGDAASPYRQLSVLLQRLTSERMRQVRDEQKRADSIPREDGKKLEELTNQNRKLEAQAADEKRRADELQKKLDALISIERDLRSRSPQRRPN